MSKNRSKGSANSRQQHIRMVVYLIGVITVAMVIEIFILNSLSAKNSNNTSLVLLNQVVSIIEQNEQSESELIQTLKEDYIIRAQTVSYILDSKPEAEQDVTELRKIADMMQIDEIHLFDETGVIYSGSEPKYYGYNFDSGEQMAYFKPMLTDKSLTMCQDVTPNTAEGKSMMYAITWNDAGDKMIQVGIEPLRLLDELRSNEISEVVANIPTYKGIDVWVADADSGVICGSTDDDLIDTTLEELGITETDIDSGTVINAIVNLDGYRNYCNYAKIGEYVVVVAYSTKANIKNFVASMLIEFIYLLMAGIVIIYMMNRLLRANDEKDEQMAMLVSMSDIYNSMHLIDLEENTIKVYNAREELCEVTKHTKVADEAMEQMMVLSTEEEYCGAAIEFSDIRTMADRMQNQKIASQVFKSNAIGWYRASIITVEADETGRPTKIIYVTQNIDKEKKREKELIFKSNTDELTSLYNRRAYENDILECNDTVTKNNFVFVSLDLNGLKKVNDTLGHIAGDELLVGAALCIKQCFGPYGKVYRVGGDEFAAMIYANEIQLEGIKKDFEEVTAQWKGTLVKTLSVSCGYVTKQEVDTTSVHAMANIADKRMYAAKAKHYENTQK